MTNVYIYIYIYTHLYIYIYIYTASPLAALRLAHRARLPRLASLVAIAPALLLLSLRGAKGVPRKGL